MARFDYYYVSESGEVTCATCALSHTVEVLERVRSHDGSHKRGEAARRLLALVRLTEPSDIDALTREVDDLLVGNWGSNCGRNRDAADLFRETVSGFDDHGDSSWGEHCGGCSVELVPPYAVCRNCDHSDYLGDCGSFTVPEGVEVEWDHAEHRHDGPTVEYCGRCEDEYVPCDAEELGTDHRGYTLTYRPAYRGRMTYGANPAEPIAIYAAGCRRLTLADALRHWNRSDEGAQTLTRLVLGHAMRQALPFVHIPADPCR